MSKKPKDTTSYTPPIEENLLGLTTSDAVNEEEAKGVIEGEKFLLGLEVDVEISASLLLDLHKIAFGHLYDWAGKWRQVEVTVGKHTPPVPNRIPNLIYQFMDELNHRISMINNEDDLPKVLAYTHHQIVFIHPFNNGNGRTARLFTNLIAYKHGYRDINIYFRSGEKREIYINAVREADKGNYKVLEDLIRAELACF